MSGNTESTSNSIKFAPMPMSALLANLLPLQQQSDTPDTSFSTDESDDSFNEDLTKKKTVRDQVNNASTPVSKESKELITFTSERKTLNDHNKENCEENCLSKQSLLNKDIHRLQQQSALKSAQKGIYPSSETKKCSVLTPRDGNARIQSIKLPTVQKKTPDVSKQHSAVAVLKVKTPTPKIKSGIRKFTPGSARQSHKKTPQQAVNSNRDRVRCELFRHNLNECPPPQPEPAPVQPEPVPVQPAPAAVAPPIAPVLNTPMNKKPLPASYAATPSYPQGMIGSNPNNKILFKTTCIKDKKYMFIKKLGTGGSSEVYKVLEVGTSCEYAVKCVYLATDQELAQGYINEVRLLRELQNSDRVIRLYDYEYDRANQFLRMVLEVGETDLSSFLRARGAGLPPALVLHYWEEMLHAVHYIHEHGVIHADLKPANFLLVCGRLKLIDFGIASAISGDATSVVRAQAAGTYSYISPEALMGGAGGGGAGGGEAPIKISFRSDVWSLGCILYSMVYGRTPFGHIPNLAKLAAILDPNHKIDYPPVNHLPQSLIATLKWCLTYNARARPSVRELLGVRHLQPPRAPLPAPLLERLRAHVSPDEFRLLQQAQV